MTPVPNFLAIDFETANRDPHTVVAIGVARVEHGLISTRAAHLVRPQTLKFVFTQLHGITPQMVEHAPNFHDVWEDAVTPLLEGCQFLAAHHAAFEHTILTEVVGSTVVKKIPLVCSQELARRAWSLKRTGLAAVSDFLGLDLDHHNPESDACACANVVIRAWLTTQGQNMISSALRA